MTQPSAAPDQPVAPLELFFHLVFVFGFTQVTTLLLEHPTWSGEHAPRARIAVGDGVAFRSMQPLAIVVPGSTVSRVRERLVRDAERIARAAGAGVVVFSGLGEAEHMRDLWRGPDVELLLEETALSTAENAARTLPLLVDRGVHEAIVVCAPAHLLRARWIFRRIYGSRGIAVRFRVARVAPTPGAIAWELAASAVARRQVRSHLK